MKVDIISEPYDSEHFIIYFSKSGKDVGFNFHICEFNKEMNCLLYDCKVVYADPRTASARWFDRTLPDFEPQLAGH